MAKVKVDEVLGLVGDVRAEVSANDAMPCWVVLFVKLLFDVCSNVLFDVELFEGSSGAVNGVLLHVLGHVGVLDYSFTVRHIELQVGEGGGGVSEKWRCYQPTHNILRKTGQSVLANQLTAWLGDEQPSRPSAGTCDTPTSFTQ